MKSKLQSLLLLGMSQNKHIHFIGIGGIGISALARHYLHEGWQVSGSDLVETENSKKLEASGVTVVYEQSAENIKTFLSKGLNPLLKV